MKSKYSRYVLVVALALTQLVLAAPFIRAQNIKQLLSKYTGNGEYSRRERVTLMLKSEEADIEVDKSTGVLVDFFNKRYYSLPVGAKYPVNISQKQAEEIAARFMTKWNVKLGTSWLLVPHETYLSDQGDAGKHYSFNWRKQTNGVYMPASADIFIDASTGSVDGFHLIDDALTIPLIWRLSADDAVAAVAHAKGWTDWELQDVELIVWYVRLPDGNPDFRRQILLWHVVLIHPQGGIPSQRYADADVDAVTGEIVEWHIYGGQPPRLNNIQKADALKRLAKQPKPKRNVKIIPPPTVFQLAKARKK